MENDINALMNKTNKKKNKSNLTYKEHAAMEELTKRKDLIITNADKGGAVVIMDTDSYIKEANRQLSDKASYKQLTQDPTLQHNRMVNQTIERFKNEKLLPQKIADGLKITNPKTPKFYISPKIHKPNNPGRPVINSIECHTSEISRFVDHHLQPVVKQIPSYIKDTNHFINKVNNFSVPVNSILVTMDVRSLYTSIPNNEGIAATKKRYDSYIHKTIPTKIITTFLALILTLNNFVFNSKFYLQIKGCAMGTICAPAYANIFMAEFEQKYVYPLIKDKSILFLRYIDDIFMVWTKSEKQLKDFMSELNQKHPSIKFDYKFDCKQIEFLDTLVYIDQQNKLQTTLFQKSSDRQNFLNAKSKHPYSLKKSIPYSQALQIRQICSTFQEYHSHSRKLAEEFVKKGYKKNVVT